MCATASCGVCACPLRMKVASAVSIRWRRKAIVCSSDSAARAGAVLQMTNKTKTRINQPCTLLNRAPKRGCAPGVTRTLDLRIRNPLLYPAELRAHFIGKSEYRKRFLLLFSRCYSTVNLVKLRKPTKTWKRTRMQNLIRHKSGSYYARAFAGGKEVWKSLRTSHLSVAQAKLAEFLKEHRDRTSNGNGEVSAKMTFGEAATT